MSLRSMLDNAFIRIGTEFKAIRILISGSGTGNVSGLATTATNLVGAINEVRSTAGNAVTSVNGTAGPGAVVIDTDDVAEGSTNLFFTQPRVRTTPITGYTSGAGVVAATDTVLQAIQKLNGNTAALTTSVVAEGSNLYFTDARVRTAPITGYTSGAGVVAATDSVLQAIQKLNGNVAALNTDSVAEGVTNLYFTQARVRSSLLTGYTSGAGTVAATDTVLQGIQKLNGNFAALINDTTPSASNVYSSTKTDSQIAAAIANVLDSAPGALDTLNELAAALGDDANFSTTITNALALKANIADTYSRTELGASLDTYDFEAVFVAALA